MYLVALNMLVNNQLNSLSNSRAVGRSENLGVPVLFGWHNLLPLVELGLTDLPKSRGAMGQHP
jgi:hypothetical protein